MIYTDYSQPKMRGNYAGPDAPSSRCLEGARPRQCLPSANSRHICDTCIQYRTIIYKRNIRSTNSKSSYLLDKTSVLSVLNNTTLSRVRNTRFRITVFVKRFRNRPTKLFQYQHNGVLTFYSCLNGAKRWKNNTCSITTIQNCKVLKARKSRQKYFTVRHCCESSNTRSVLNDYVRCFYSDRVKKITCLYVNILTGN